MEKNSEYLKKLGSRIRELRIEKNMTQGDLAAKIGKDYQSVQRVERGAVNPSIQYLREIAEGLSISLEELLHDLDNNEL